VKIGLVVHSGRDASREAAASAARLLSQGGADVVVARLGDDPDGLPARVEDPEDFVVDLDLAISFGGDGTFLRAAHLCRDVDVAVLGVNLGRLGFLAEVELDELHRAIGIVLDDGARQEELRGTLEMTAHGPDGAELACDWALNEVSIEKSARQRLLLMDVHVGDRLFAKVPADALVVATTTGSTAYALSAGGPLLSPQVEATLVVPIAPHTLFDRTLVVGPCEPVRIDLPDDQPAAVVSCDGREPVLVPAGGYVLARGGGRPVRLARTAPTDFYALVRRKFGLR
jgi:NAD+ kinase